MQRHVKSLQGFMRMQIYTVLFERQYLFYQQAYNYSFLWFNHEKAMSLSHMLNCYVLLFPAYSCCLWLLMKFNLSLLDDACLISYCKGRGNDN